jgi:IclR family mhp operon transcriptional activator
LILTREVQRLADGFTEAHWVTQIGAVEVGALHRKVGWPTNLATFDGEGMLVRESTHRFSSLMTHRSMVGARMFMASSMGLAFAAHMVEVSYNAMLGLVARDSGTSLAQTATLLRLTRERGYALVSETSEPNIAAIAVPVFHHDVVVAAINIVVDIRLLPLASMVETLRDPLLRAAKNLEAKIAAIPIDSILA